MIRIFLTIAVVASVTTVAAAGEESVWFTDQPALALESPSVRDESSATTSEPNRGRAETSTDIALALAQTPSTDSGKDNKEGSSANANLTENQDRPFRPVCDCGWHVPCLDRWCVWDTVCCDEPWCTIPPCECAHGKCCLSEDGQWFC